MKKRQVWVYADTSVYGDYCGGCPWGKLKTASLIKSASPKGLIEKI